MNRIFKSIVFACLVVGLQAQTQTKPAGASPEMVEELEKLNRSARPQRSWIAGADNEVLVYYDAAMSWKIQSTIMRKTVAKTYREKGVLTLVVFNGKDAWTGPTTEEGEMVAYKGGIPVPSINQSYLNLPGVEDMLSAYNKNK